MSNLDKLKSLVPINSFSPNHFRELAAGVRFRQLSAGDILFQQGDQDKYTYYLLDGEIGLSTKENWDDERVIAAGSDKARYALAQLKPRQYTGEAKTGITVAEIDSATMDRLLTKDQATGYEVMEFDGGQDVEWMWHMLASSAFNILPPENINAMFARVEAVEAKAGQVIVRQGDAGDYYYIIRSGSAVVTRTDRTGKNDEVLGELGECNAFGEEALISGAPRNATVIMKTDGVLMRLAKKDFDNLLKAPVVRWVGPVEAKRMVQAGAGLIDVRLEEEFHAGTIKGSTNISLYNLRQKAEALDRSQPYIVFCQTGSRSSVAAFLLSQRGFDVYALQGGLGG